MRSNSTIGHTESARKVMDAINLRKDLNMLNVVKNAELVIDNQDENNLVLKLVFKTPEDAGNFNRYFQQHKLQLFHKLTGNRANPVYTNEVYIGLGLKGERQTAYARQVLGILTDNPELAEQYYNDMYKPWLREKLNIGKKSFSEILKDPKNIAILKKKYNDKAFLNVLFEVLEMEIEKHISSKLKSESKEMNEFEKNKNDAIQKLVAYIQHMKKNDGITDINGYQTVNKLKGYLEEIIKQANMLHFHGQSARNPLKKESDVAKHAREIANALVGYNNLLAHVKIDELVFAVPAKPVTEKVVKRDSLFLPNATTHDPNASSANEPNTKPSNKKTGPQTG